MASEAKAADVGFQRVLGKAARAGGARELKLLKGRVWEGFCPASSPS